MTRATTLTAATALAVLAAASAAGVRAQQPAAQAGAPRGDIRVQHIRDSIYGLFGAGANITASVGPDGILLVDTGRAEMTDGVLTALARIQREAAIRSGALRDALPRFGVESRSTILDSRDPAPEPRGLRYIINTAAHADHIGGNPRLAALGETMTFGAAGGAQSAQLTGRLAEGAAIIGHEQMLLRLGTGKIPLASEGWPTSTYYGAYKSLSHHFNGDGVQVIHLPAASTGGDSIVHLRRADVIAAGDIFSMSTYPVIDLDGGGSINGVVDALNRLLDMAVVEFRAEGGTVIVPGHGRLADRADLAYYRDMATVIRDRVRDMVRRGLTLEQVRAARPTLDYDPRFGAASGAWTTDLFVEAVYRSLSSGGPGSAASSR